MTFFFTIVFVVMVFWRPQEWLAPALYDWNLLDMVVYAALLGLMLEARAGRIRIPTAAPQLFLLAGLWFAAVMSHVAHTYFAGMMETIPEVLKICLFTALFLCVLDSPERLRWVAVVFVGMSCMMGVHALMQERLGVGFGGLTPLYVAESARGSAHTRSFFYGIFGDPNDLAQVLATSIPFSFVLWRRRSLAGLIVGGAIAAFLVAGILATHSRGGYVAAAAMFGVMFCLLFPRRWLPALLGMLTIGVLILIPFSSAYLDESAHDRVIFWGEANWVFKENLLFGVGYGMFNDYIDKSRAAHNAFVLCYTELGLFGYWFWFILLQLAVVGAWRVRMAFSEPETDEQEYLRRFSGCGIAAMSGFAVSSYFLTRAFVYPLFFLFAVLGVLPIMARKHLPEDHAPLLDFRRDVLLFGTIGALGSVGYIYASIILLNRAFYG